MRVVVVLAGAIAAALSVSSCGDRTLPARGQLVVFVDTDAPLAFSVDDDAAERSQKPAPLFDQLRIDVIDAAGAPACELCKQDFNVDRGQLARDALSVGLFLPPGRSDLRLRARLFRGFRARTGEPFIDGSIDRTFTLPAVGPEGVVEVTAFLPLDVVGRGSNADAPDAIASGRVLRHTLYDGVVPRECVGTATANEVCVPGGVYWMSSGENTIFTTGVTSLERVVVISPFFMDKREVTVREMRASKLFASDDPKRGSGTPGECTFTEKDGPNEDLPVDCLTWNLARRFCEKRGGTLPTEAQLELLGTGLRSQRYVWGADQPTCGDAIYGRAGKADGVIFRPCLALGTGPERAGSGARDVLHFPTGDVVDIAGNVAEWARDEADALDGACWGLGIFIDPVCEGDPRRDHIYRGGSWNAPALNLRFAAARGYGVDLADSLLGDIGFRCARADDAGP